MYKRNKLYVKYIDTGKRHDFNNLEEVKSGVRRASLDGNSGWEQSELHDLGDGSQVVLSRACFSRSHKKVFFMRQGQRSLAIHVCLSGISEAHFTPSRQIASLDRMQFGVVGYRQAEGANYIAANEEHCTCQFFISTIVIKRLFEDQKIPGSLSSFLDERSDQVSLIKSKQSRAMRRIALETLSSPYEGATHRLYMHSKKLEALTELMDIISAGTKKTNTGFSSNERRRINETRDILISRIANPPSLAELASEAGMNYKKLNKGFKEQYGATIFAFLRDYRLDLAKAVLEKEPLALSELSAKLGYSHPNNFIHAFKNRFGVTPGRYRGNRIV